MIDYMVMEAVAIRVQQADRKMEEERKRKNWKGDTSHLNKFA